MQKYCQGLRTYLGELAKIMPSVAPQHNSQPVPRANIPPAKPTLDLNKRVNFGKLPIAHQSNVQRHAAHEKPQSTNVSFTATPIEQPSLADSAKIRKPNDSPASPHGKSLMRKIDAPKGQPNLFRRSENKSVLSGPTKYTSHTGSHWEPSRKSLTAKANTSSNPLQVVENSSSTLSELTSNETRGKLLEPDLSKTQSFMPTISALPIELNISGINSQLSNLAATQPVQTSGSFNNRRRARNSQRRETRRGNRNRKSRKKNSGNRKSRKKTSRKKNSRRRTERENVKTDQSVNNMDKP
jgi:hypothetical protein